MTTTQLEQQDASEIEPNQEGVGFDEQAFLDEVEKDFNEVSIGAIELGEQTEHRFEGTDELVQAQPIIDEYKTGVEQAGIERQHQINELDNTGVPNTAYTQGDLENLAQAVKNYEGDKKIKEKPTFTLNKKEQKQLNDAVEKSEKLGPILNATEDEYKKDAEEIDKSSLSYLLDKDAYYTFMKYDKKLESDMRKLDVDPVGAPSEGLNFTLGKRSLIYKILTNIKANKNIPGTWSPEELAAIHKVTQGENVTEKELKDFTTGLSRNTKEQESL